jgi:predicted small secreted protein
LKLKPTLKEEIHMKKFIVVMMALLFSMSIASCDNSDDIADNIEDAGDQVEDAADEVGDNLEEAADDVEDAVEDGKPASG